MNIIVIYIINYITSLDMSSAFANFATLVGVYDGTLYNGATLDVSTNIGNGDLSLNAANQQYLMNSNSYTAPSATSGNGMTFTGWFYYNSAQTTGAVIFDLSSISTTDSIILTCSNTGVLTGKYNTTSFSTTATAVTGSWNFFTYIVECSGTSVASQALYLNSSIPNSTNYSGTYVGGSVYSRNMIGYGTGAGLNYFNGKIDDFRYYNRVLTQPEIMVLSTYNYKSTVNPISPILYLNKDVVTTVGAANVVLDLSGAFSYVTVSRAVTAGSGTSATFNVSCSAMTVSSDFKYAKWTDTTSATGNTYSYTITPYVLSALGSSVTIAGVTI